MLKLSLKLPKRHQDDFFKEWIPFFVAFLENPLKEEVDQIIFNLWELLPQDTSKYFNALISENIIEDLGTNWKTGKKYKQEREFFNFNTAPVEADANNLKDLWAVGDSLVPVVAIKDIPRVLEEFCNIKSESMYFSTTSLAKNYIIRIYHSAMPNDYFYTRFFK